MKIATSDDGRTTALDGGCSTALTAMQIAHLLMESIVF